MSFEMAKEILNIFYTNELEKLQQAKDPEQEDKYSYHFLVSSTTLPIKALKTGNLSKDNIADPS